MINFYEYHEINDIKFPIICRYKQIDNRTVPHLLHWHENIEFLYIIGKEALVNIGGDILTVHDKDLITVNSCQMHDIYTSNEETFVFYLIINKGLSESYGFSIDEKNVMQKIHDPIITNYIEQILQELQDKEKYYKEAVLGLIQVFLSYTFRNYETSPYLLNKSTKNDSIKNAIYFMQKHYHEPISLEVISEKVKFNKFYFEKIFKEGTGMTVINYLTHLRVKQSTELLCKSDLSIEQISTRCGFDNQSYFTKVFKKYLGVTPKKYRDENDKLS